MGKFLLTRDRLAGGNLSNTSYKGVLQLDVVDRYGNTSLWLDMRFDTQKAIEAFLL
jgi:hypothetical protein